MIWLKKNNCNDEGCTNDPKGECIFDNDVFEKEGEKIHETRPNIEGGKEFSHNFYAAFIIGIVLIVGIKSKIAEEEHNEGTKILIFMFRVDIRNENIHKLLDENG